MLQLDQPPPLSLDQLIEEARGLWNVLHRFALRLLGNYQDAEDAVSTAMLDAVKAGVWTKVRSKEELQAYLFTCVRHECYKIRKHRGSHHEEPLRSVFADGREGPERARQEPDVVDQLIGDEQAEMVRSIIAGLPAIHRDILILRYLRGLSYAEIAEKLEVTGVTARVRCNRAVTFFKEARMRREIKQ